ncbi:type IV CRISPR-associated protein Csf3 [Thiohalocapsa marina]|uniref:type IV CRISPR-associated protein Csf3 n=1 Tax=Thiohalocapsa marina TaxID=424902 RepID=UPI0036DEF595
MGPYRVTFRLATPMHAPEQPIHLDAILAWAAVDAARGDLNAQDALPLERYVGGDGRWVWKASRVLLKVEHRTGQMMTRSFEPWHWGEDRCRVYTKGPRIIKPGTGPLKGYVLSVPTLQVSIAQAWYIGDADAIATLLSRVTHLGKLRRLDFGRITDIQVTEDREALERWTLRSLPDTRPGYRRCLQTLRPPYFDRSLRESAWEPPAVPT